MKNLKIVLLAIWYVAAVLAGCFLGLAIADYFAYKSAADDEYLEIFELCYEHDRNCDIVQMDYHNIKNGKATWLCVRDDETEPWLVNLELKKVAPFRYEWVEIDL